MKKEKLPTLTKQDLVCFSEEIAWRALMAQPRDVYMEWLDGSLCNVKELIDLFDYLNDKIRHHNAMRRCRQKIEK